jgi:tetratricopeptide (TPR) repeat protein
MSDDARDDGKATRSDGLGSTVLVCLLAVAPFLPKLGNGLLLWDDERFIRQMTLIHSLANFGRFFAHGVDGLYRPLRDALYALSYDTFGFADRPLGWQIVGLVLHALCAALFYRLARRLLAGGVAALAAGALFATHPIHVERVAGITASYDLLGDALLLAALLAYVGRERADGGPAKSWGWLGWLTAGLFASENAAIFPLLAVAIDAVRTPTFRALLRRDRLVRYAAALVVIAFYLACRWAAVGALGRGVPRPIAGLTNNALAVAAADRVYVAVALLPWRANYFHLIDLHALPQLWTAWLALLAVVALPFLGFALRRRTALGLGALWFFICLLPTSQFAPNINFCQERYAYLAFGGVALVLGAAAGRLFERASGRTMRWLLTALGAAVLLLLGAMTWSYAAAFHDDLALWSRVAAVEPRHAGAQNNVGAAWLRRGRPDLALRSFERACELDPAFTIPLKNIALSWEMLGRADQAAAAYERYLRVAPGDRDAAADYQRLRAQPGN